MTRDRRMDRENVVLVGGKVKRWELGGVGVLIVGSTV